MNETTKTISEKFQEHDISFLFATGDVMVNATQMAKAFGKRVRDFRENETFSQFCEEIKKTPKFLDYVQRKRANIGPFKGGEIGGISNIELDNYLITAEKGRHGQTYMYRTLALKFAAWLSSSFEFWIYDTIENILYSEKSREIIEYLHQYPSEKNLKNMAEVELFETRQRTDYFKLDQERKYLEFEIEGLKEEQGKVAIQSLVNDQGEIFSASRKNAYEQYVKLQKQINILESRIKEIKNKIALLDQRPDIKQLIDLVSLHNKKMVALKKKISI